MEATPIKFTDTIILLGTDETLLNVFLIDAKIQIYHARKQGTPPDIKKIINTFTRRRAVEEVKAKRTFKLMEHKIKWSKIIKYQQSPIEI